MLKSYVIKIGNPLISLQSYIFKKFKLHVGMKEDLSFNLRHFWPMKSFRRLRFPRENRIVISRFLALYISFFYFIEIDWNDYSILVIILWNDTLKKRTVWKVHKRMLLFRTHIIQNSKYAKWTFQNIVKFKGFQIYTYFYRNVITYLNYNKFQG